MKLILNKIFGIMRCEYCGRILCGQYATDHWGTVFCPEHAHEWPSCTYCGRLVEPTFSSGDSHDAVRCSHCRKSEISDMGQARPLFMELIQWLNQRRLLFNNLPLSIEFRTRAEVHQQVQGNGDTLGFCLRTRISNGGGERDTVQVGGVALLKGLPESVFCTTVAHELGHAWLSVHQVNKLPAWFEEGFCQCLAYLHCVETNTKESLYQAETIAKQPDAIYGDGFRRVHTAATKMGFNSIIDHLKKHIPFTI